MKHLSILTEPYRVILQEFAAYILALGFRSQTKEFLPAMAREFLHCLERKNVFSVRSISPQLVQEHYTYITQRPNQRREGLGLSASMITHHIYALRLFFGWLEKLGVMDMNPMNCLEFPRLHGPVRLPLTLEAIEDLYKACETPLEKALLGLFYGCGLRRSEAEALDIRDINWSASKVVVRHGKYNKRREVPLHPKVHHDLRQYYEIERAEKIDLYQPTKAFLLGRLGQRFRGNDANRTIKKLAQKAELTDTVSLHVLRHSIATHLLDKGMSLDQIRQFLGHSSLDVTERYVLRHNKSWRQKRSHYTNHKTKMYQIS